jgi:hypothetical protein
MECAANPLVDFKIAPRVRHEDKQERAGDRRYGHKVACANKVSHMHVHQDGYAGS